MNPKGLVVYIHGIQDKEFNPDDVRQFIDKIDAHLPAGKFTHHISDWAKIVGDRQRQLFALTNYRGNWLTRKIRFYICTLGMDMWMWLQTKNGNMDGDWAKDIRDQLDSEIDFLDAQLKENEEKPELSLVSHSWGTIIALDYFIRHPWRKGKVVTMGSPAPMKGSACFHDWGDPALLKNITRWVNIGTPNDPISEMMHDNPNPTWAGKVEDHDLFYLTNFLPMDAHKRYWKDPRVHKLIAETLDS